jgi:formate hydrogenlyase transcriptional activator
MAMEPREPVGTREDEAARYRTLLEINNALIANLTRDTLFRAIARALRQVVPYDRTAIFLHEPAREVLRLFVLESSLPSTYFVVGLELPVEDTHVGWAFRHRRVLLRYDLSVERRYPMEERAYEDGVRSYLAVPLLARDRCLGVLAVASTSTDRYDEADAGTLRAVGGQVALAVEQMHAYEEIQALSARAAAAAEQHRTLLEVNNAIISNLTQSDLFHAVAGALGRIVAFDRIAIFLYDEARGVLRLSALETSLPSAYYTVGLEMALADTPGGWVVRHQQPYLQPDLTVARAYRSEERAYADGIRSVLVLPLIARGRSIGTVALGSAIPGRYSTDDATLLQQVAGQVALAVANMTAYEEIATLKARLEHENVYLQEEIRREHDFVEMVGASAPLLRTLQQVEQVAPTDSTVLVSGETGTGKELIARAIHHRSSRRDRPLVKVNCSAISAGLVESELFGHVKGAFTGALERRIGRFELAHRGTIFLDEIGDLPLDTQVKLLRVLQEREFEPVGSSRTIAVDVRVIAATNRDLTEAVRAGRFRADLYYRLNVFPIEVPPLRHRRADIPQLVTFFLGRFGRRFGKRIDRVSAETMGRLTAYAWPGNVRELQNVIERAVVLCTGPVLEIDPALLPRADGSPAGASPADAPEGLNAALAALERSQIVGALDRTRGVIEGPGGAAALLRVHPNTLRSRMDKLGIKRPGNEGR